IRPATVFPRRLDCVPARPGSSSSWHALPILSRMGGALTRLPRRQTHAKDRSCAGANRVLESAGERLDGSGSRTMIEIRRRGNGELLFCVEAETLEDASLREADLQRAELRGANLRGACLFRANLA